MSTETQTDKGTMFRAGIVIPLVILAFFAGALLLIAWLPAMVQAAPAALPPRPSPTPTNEPVVTPPATPPTGVPTSQPAHRAPAASALIRLQAYFDPARIPWQTLWTVVQWQDGQGEWHNVDGWQGTFDEVTGNEGQKVWWVAKAHLGTGPFRWMIYNSNTGKIFAVSNHFYLPAALDQAVIVQVQLAP